MHAEIAVKELTQAGFLPDQIGIVIPDAPAGIEAPHLPTGTLAEEGALAGAAGGAVVGAVVGMALTAAILPGVGLALVGGFLMASLAGAAGGSMLGALVGMGVPEEEAHAHAEAFHSGRTLVTVRAGTRYDEAVGILQRAAEQRDPREIARLRARLSEMAEDNEAPPSGAAAFVPRP
jgi:hypothetical protein